LHELLTHPAVLSGLVPFLVALVIAELFRRLSMSELALFSGFAVTVFIISDFGVDPFTTTRKLVWLGLGSTMVGLVFTPVKTRKFRPILALAGGIASIWLTVAVLAEKKPSEGILWGAGGFLFLTWLIYWMDTLRESPLRAASAATALGLGCGGAALFSASALLGQLGLAAGAAAAALLLLNSFSDMPNGRALTLPAAVISGSVGLLAALTAQLPWYALTALAAIPLAAKIPVAEKSPLWVQSLLLSALTLSFAAGAAYLSWQTAGQALR